MSREEQATERYAIEWDDGGTTWISRDELRDRYASGDIDGGQRAYSPQTFAWVKVQGLPAVSDLPRARRWRIAKTIAQELGGFLLALLSIGSVFFTMSRIRGGGLLPLLHAAHAVHEADETVRRTRRITRIFLAAVVVSVLAVTVIGIIRMIAGR
jgi:hypothetical protein